MSPGEVGLYDVPSAASQRRAAERFRKRRLETTTSLAITAEQLQRARNEAAAAERRRVGEVLASLTAAGAIDGNQARALVQLLTHPTTVADNVVARYEKRMGKNTAAGASTGAAIASLYEQTMGR